MENTVLPTRFPSVPARTQSAAISQKMKEEDKRAGVRSPKNTRPDPIKTEPGSTGGGGGGGAAVQSPKYEESSSVGGGGGGGGGGCGASSSEQSQKRRRVSKSRAFELEEAPVFRPTAQEFSEPLDYIASIRTEAEKYGICRIVPPKQWQPSFQLEHDPRFKFNTRKQRIHQLYTRYGPNSQFIACLKEHLLTEGQEVFVQPMMGSMELDLFQLSKLVHQHGGLQTVINKSKWGKIADELKISKTVSSRNERVQAFYYRYLLSYDMLQQSEKAALQSRVLKKRDSAASAGASAEDDAFGFETGKSHNLESFRRMANEFKETWYKSRSKPHDVSASELEAEFWKILEDSDRHVAVSYGSDVDTTKTGSGFSTSPDDPYSKFGWNLNVLPGLEGSILKHVSGISGISMPWLYVGMLFSTFCWHNEDNYLYSINYHHFGAPKLWYGVPGEDAHKLEECFAKYMPDEFDKRPLLLHDLVTMLSPARLIQDGIRVCRTLQEEREFVVTFPQAYHSGFSTGFNCGEAVNFAAADWIPFGLKAVEDYAKQKRPVSLDQEQLLVNTARFEKNIKTLGFVIPQLIELRDREELLRERLTGLGVGQTSIAALNGRESSWAQSKELGNIFQPKPTMAGYGGGGIFAGMTDGAGGSSEDQDVEHTAGRMAWINGSSARASAGGGGSGGGGGRMGGSPDSLQNNTCTVCRRICYLSLVRVNLDRLRPAATTQGVVVRCLSCTLNGTEEAIAWKSKVEGATALTLTTRFEIAELNTIIEEAQARASYID
jgi:hypothetical protein